MSCQHASKSLAQRSGYHDVTISSRREPTGDTAMLRYKRLERTPPREHGIRTDSKATVNHDDMPAAIHTIRPTDSAVPGGHAVVDKRNDRTVTGCVTHST